MPDHQTGMQDWLCSQQIIVYMPLLPLSSIPVLVQKTELARVCKYPIPYSSYNESLMLCFIANSGLTPSTALTQALKTYQNTVQLLLDSESYPGLSREELETFKTTYRTEAYTCRYSRCPRASNGFKSDQLRCQHENDVHRQSLKCTVPECKFGLSFASNRALKSHIQKYHSLPSTKNYPQSIRRLLPPSQGDYKEMKVSLVLYIYLVIVDIYYRNPQRRMRQL